MKDMEINFSLTDCSGEKFQFTNLRSLLGFCEKERDFWQKEMKIAKEIGFHPRDIPDQFSFARQLMSLVDWHEVASDEPSKWNQVLVQKEIQHRCSSLGQRFWSSWLYSGHTYTKNFITCFKQHGKVAAEAFLFYIQKKHSQIPGDMNFDQLKGYIAAYEFENQNSDLVKRRKGERAATGKIWKEFVESKDQIFGEVAALKTDYENLSTEAKQELVEELEAWQQQRAENNEKVFQAITQYQKSVSDSIDAHNAEVETFKKEALHKIRALEETYEERLRLEPAAKYWKDSAGRLRAQGGILGTLIMITVVIGLVAGGYLFHIWLSHEKLPIDLTSLQGVLITITVLAIYAYILRLLSRMTFSSFHLMRDAEEREQLTYLYLALSNQTDVDEKSREIVLQALFSRSETGLLTNEHGPVMPGMDLNQLLKGMGR
jgi:hypothetical protein